MPVPKGLEPTGVILADKPAGPSSFAIVARVRSRTGAKTGHAGTLDPFATGLLILLSGRATSLQARFMKLDKRYLTQVDLSLRTTTGDPQGVDVAMPTRVMRVHRLELLAYEGGVARLDLDVGSGTYVRSLADALGGHCVTLRRTEIGPFRVEEADEMRVLSLEEALPRLAAVRGQAR